MKNNKQLLSLNSNIYISRVYTPPPSSKELIDRDIDFFELELELENDIEIFEKLGKTYLTGDYNFRASNISDVLEFDEYLDTLQEFEYHEDNDTTNLLHNRLQEANLDDTIFTVKMEFLFSSCKTIITLAKYIEISLKHHV